MLVLLDPRLWLGLIVGLALGYLTGYGHKARIDRAQAAAEQKAPQAAGTVMRETITVVDRVSLGVLEARLADQKRQTADLQRQIAEAKNAQGVPSADCRLPWGLRDAINRDLAAEGSQ